MAEDADDKFDYAEQMQVAQMVVRNFYTLAICVDFDKIIERMDRAEAVAPFVDPTLWMRGRDGLKSQRRLIEAANAFKQAIEQQIADEGAAKR